MRSGSDESAFPVLLPFFSLSTFPQILGGRRQSLETFVQQLRTAPPPAAQMLSGAKNSYIATLVECHWRFAMLIKVSSRDMEVVVAPLSRHVRKLPATCDDQLALRLNQRPRKTLAFQIPASKLQASVASTV